MYLRINRLKVNSMDRQPMLNVTSQPRIGLILEQRPDFSGELSRSNAVAAAACFRASDSLAASGSMGGGVRLSKVMILVRPHRHRFRRPNHKIPQR